MVDYRELDRIAKDASTVRSMARMLLSYPGTDWSDWEVDFLRDRLTHQDGQALSTRQAEVLLELRDETEHFTSWKKFSISALIEQAWLLRFDLDVDEDIEFIEELKGSGRTSLQRRKIFRLMRCCRELEILEAHHH
jgi:hypothetical protein